MDFMANRVSNLSIWKLLINFFLGNLSHGGVDLENKAWKFLGFTVFILIYLCAFQNQQKKKGQQFDSKDLTVLTLFDFIPLLTFYVMTPLEYVAINTDDEFKYFRSPFHIFWPNHKVSSKSFIGNCFFTGSSTSKSLNHHKEMHLIK